MQSPSCAWFVLLFLWSTLSFAAPGDQSWQSLITNGEKAVQQRKFDEALRFFTQSVEAAGQVTEHLALSTHDIGFTYHTTGDFKRAEALYRRALGYWEESGKPSDRFALAMVNLGDLLMDQHRYREGQQQMERAAGMFQEMYGARDSRVAVALSKLGLSCDAIGQTSRAESLLRDAVEIHRNASTTEKLELAGSLDNLAKFYTAHGRYKEAEPLFQQSLEMVGRIVGEHDLGYAVSLQNLATMHRMAGNGARAQPLLRKAAVIDEAVLGSRHPLVIMILSEQGLVALREKDYTAAASYLQKVYDLSREVYGPDHLKTIFAESNLALSFTRTGKLELARKMLNHVLETERNSPDVSPHEFARSLTNSAELSTMLQDTKQAEAYYREAIPIWRSIAAEHGDELGTALQKYARVLKAGQHKGEARSIEKEAKAFLGARAVSTQ